MDMPLHTIECVLIWKAKSTSYISESIPSTATKNAIQKYKICMLSRCSIQYICKSDHSKKCYGKRVDWEWQYSQTRLASLFYKVWGTFLSPTVDFAMPKRFATNLCDFPCLIFWRMMLRCRFEAIIGTRMRVHTEILTHVWMRARWACPVEGSVPPKGNDGFIHSYKLPQSEGRLKSRAQMRLHLGWPGTSWTNVRIAEMQVPKDL